MDQDAMRRRTKEFALRVIDLCRQLPDSREGRLIGNQLFRSGTSIGANYRAACRGRSRADFISKLGIALEESDETVYILKSDILSPVLTEARELLAILVATVNTAKTNGSSLNGARILREDDPSFQFEI